MKDKRSPTREGQLDVGWVWVLAVRYLFVNRHYHLCVDSCINPLLSSIPFRGSRSRWNCRDLIVVLLMWIIEECEFVKIYGLSLKRIQKVIYTPITNSINTYVSRNVLHIPIINKYLISLELQIKKTMDTLSPILMDRNPLTRD